MISRLVKLIEASLGSGGSIGQSGAGTVTAPGTKIITSIQILSTTTFTGQTDKAGYENAVLSNFTNGVDPTIIYGKWTEVVIGDGNIICYYE